MGVHVSRSRDHLSIPDRHLRLQVAVQRKRMRRYRTKTILRLFEESSDFDDHCVRHSMIARKAAASATRSGFTMTMATTSSTKALAVSFLHLFARRASLLVSKGSQPSTGKTTRRKVNRIGEYRGFCATPCWFVAARRPIMANRVVCGCASHCGLYGGTTLRATMSPPR